MRLEERIKELEQELRDSREECKQSLDIIATLTKTLESVTSSKDELALKVDELTKCMEKQRIISHNEDLEVKLETALKKQEQLQKEIDMISSMASATATTITEATATSNGTDSLEKTPSSSTIQTAKTSAASEDSKVTNGLPEDPVFHVRRDTKLNKNSGKNEDVVAKIMSITSKPENNSKSLEELRLEYYISKGMIKTPSNRLPSSYNNSFYKYDNLYNLAMNLKLHIESTDHRQNQGCRMCGFAFMNTSSTVGVRENCPRCFSVNIVGTLTNSYRWFMCNECCSVQQGKPSFFQKCLVCRKAGSIIDVSHLAALNLSAHRF